ncbi:GNAT family N-acetyltransferase [Vibrio mediterranei]|uniref:GNAT family N-acetyltransferase n=1 Tax=Vibrio mediterranei TaxID=689 RepID=UPI00148DBD1F|nr:GNAT family N-acetyltransferase [Vibrio mediterranei]NOH31007.1 GNAT family N-acetyltransferase [Vibrio mediterranei]
MKKIKADLFTIHTSINEIAKANAKWAIDRLNTPTQSQANIIKKYKEYYKKRMSDPLSFVKESVVYLSCSVTKEEIGFYIQIEHTCFTRLSIIFIKPKYRGRGFSKVLIKHFEDNANGLTLIDSELDGVHKHNDDIFKHCGYKYSSTIGNGRVSVLTKIEDFDSYLFDYVDFSEKENNKLKLFDKKTQEHKKILKNCQTEADFLKIRNKLNHSFLELESVSLVLEYLMYQRDNDFISDNAIWCAFVEQYIVILESITTEDTLVA